MDLELFKKKYNLNKELNTFFHIKSDYPDDYIDWHFAKYPDKYTKYKRLLAYSEPYTKHYSFQISCKQIDLNNQFDKDFIEMVKSYEKQINDAEENTLTITDGNDIYYENNIHYMDLNTISNKSFLNVNFIFQLYHFNWKYFYFIKKDYNYNFQRSRFDTTKLSEDDLLRFKGSIEDGYFEINEQINSKDYYRLPEPDIELLKEFISYNKPMYMFMMPEDITTFKHAFNPHKGKYGVEQVYAISDNYLYYIRFQD